VTCGSNSSSVFVLLHEEPLVVDAGPDVFTTAAGRLDITLTATVRSAHTGVTFLWKEGTSLLGSGPSLKVSLASGTHQIRVEALAADGAFASDTVVVALAPSFASQKSLDALHAKVDGLDAPLREATAALEPLAKGVGQVAEGVRDQTLLVSALVTLVQGRLDTNVSSRASSQELAAAVATLKAAGLGQASLDALDMSVRGAVAGARKDLLRAHIETALARGDVVASFARPEASGGALETVRAIVKDTLAFHPASDRERRQAQRLFANGDVALGGGDYVQAYRRFADAYQALTR
jgi:hypothetical protein